MTRQIKQADNEALVNIVLDYLRGYSIDEITLRLNEQCLKFNIPCKTRFQALLWEEDTGEANHLDNILDQLSIGGASIHAIPVERAKQEGKFNAYVWDAGVLTYLHLSKPDEIIALNDSTPLNTLIQTLTQIHKSTSVHLFAKQIETLITNNSHAKHSPHTTHPEQLQYYKSSPNLYDALKRLAQQHPRLFTLIEKINEAKPKSRAWLYWLLATGATAITGLVFYLKDHVDTLREGYERALPIVSRWLSNTANLIKNTPIIGIVFQGYSLLSTWYQAIMDDLNRNGQFFIKLAFKTTEQVLPIIGYVLCYLAAGVMTIPAMSMFIAAATIEVIESLYALIAHQIARFMTPLPPATEYHSAVETAIAKNTTDQNLYSSLVKIITHSLITASVIIMCVFPPSLMIALPCMLCSMFIGLTKHSLLAHINQTYTDALQTELKDISDRYHPPCQTKELEHLALKHENVQLKRKVRELTQQSRQLTFFSNNHPSPATVEPDETYLPRRETFP